MVDFEDPPVDQTGSLLLWGLGCGLLTGLTLGVLWGVGLATAGGSAASHVVPGLFDGVARTVFMWVVILHSLYGVAMGWALAQVGALGEAQNSMVMGALITGMLGYFGSSLGLAMLAGLYGGFFGFACHFLAYSLLRRRRAA